MNILSEILNVIAISLVFTAILPVLILDGFTRTDMLVSVLSVCGLILILSLKYIILKKK
jgi:hypothetical protein